MRCSFCGELIHFFEEIWVVEGHYFHAPAITPTAIRCNRRHSKLMEKAEKEVKK